MSPLQKAWAVAFIWTLALELPVVVLLTRRGFRTWWGPCVAAAVVNLITHPSLWFSFPRFEPYATWLLVAEGVVWTTEAALLSVILMRRLPARQAWAHGTAAAVAANALTTAVGLLFFT